MFLSSVSTPIHIYMKSEIHSKDKIIMRVNNWKLKEIISSQMNRSVGKCISKCSRRSIIFVITELVTEAIYYFSISKVSKRSISLRCQQRKCEIKHRDQWNWNRRSWKIDVRFWYLKLGWGLSQTYTTMWPTNGPNIMQGNWTWKWWLSNDRWTNDET